MTTLADPEGQVITPAALAVRIPTLTKVKGQKGQRTVCENFHMLHQRCN